MIGFALSLGVILVYYTLLIFGEVLAKKGILPPGLGIWLPNIVFGAIGPALIFWMAEQ